MGFETAEIHFFLKMSIFSEMNGQCELYTGSKLKTLNERKSYFMWFWFFKKDFEEHGRTLSPGEACFEFVSMFVQRTLSTS